MTSREPQPRRVGICLDTDACPIAGHPGSATVAERERARCWTSTAIPSRELAVPGVKSEVEKFAGAHRTWTVEAKMGGKNWALQASISPTTSARSSASSSSIVTAAAVTPATPRGASAIAPSARW